MTQTNWGTFFGGGKGYNSPSSANTHPLIALM